LAAYAAEPGASATGFAGILSAVFSVLNGLALGDSQPWQPLYRRSRQPMRLLGQHRRNEELYDKANGALAELLEERRKRVKNHPTDTIIDF
jgi:hypothetical protein